MSSEFLHIIKIPGNNLSDLEAFYSSSYLKEAITGLIKGEISRIKVQDRKVLLKPNWVLHSIRYADRFCMRTNDSFVIAVLGIILEMGPSAVIIGDAPVQGCKWDIVISESFKDSLNRLSSEYGIPVWIRDFRRRTYSVIDNKPRTDVRPLSDYVIFDIGDKSMLEPVTESGPTKFRVTNYDPDRMSLAHSTGMHKYCIARELFEADLIISLPKIKTHQKTGLTGALKNIVGINGDKDFLPHHRIGGAGRRGDCYPGKSYLRYWSERLLDNANRKQGRKSFWYWQKCSSLLWRLSLPGPEHHISAGWYGNDTTWRMVMDLNQIVYYGRSDGNLYPTRQREVLALSDGIIAGQGNGPLYPEPLPLGVILFSNNPALHDIAATTLMGLDFRKFRLLTEASCFFGNNSPDITLNGEQVVITDLIRNSVNAEPPIGWKSYLSH